MQMHGSSVFLWRNARLEFGKPHTTDSGIHFSLLYMRQPERWWLHDAAVDRKSDIENRRNRRCSAEYFGINSQQFSILC